MAQKPVVFLAFANDQEDKARYLRGLNKEKTRIRQALEYAEEAGLCEVIVEVNATVKSIVSTFQKARYRDRIALFHYGGHADGYQLMLETLEGTNVAARGEGLTSFLGGQESLQLVFLNGCSTQQLALDLTEAGVPAVIGTSHSIADDVATQLAVDFYSAFGQGASIQRAWKEAEDQVLTQHDPGSKSGKRSLFWNPDAESEPDFFPWDLYVKRGGELVRNWNLPEAVDNPLFGLPEPAYQYHLPEQPYRFLQRYERAHHRIFFGRSYYIRDLFDRVTSQTSAPVLLLYGQSGVGKSSMLDAGVFPRLEQVAEVVYARRDPQQGLLATFYEALGRSGSKVFDPEQFQRSGLPKPTVGETGQAERELVEIERLALRLDPESRQAFEQAIQQVKARQKAFEEAAVQLPDEQASTPAEALTPRQAWKAIEASAGKPLVVLLDQVEEIFTQERQDDPQELTRFLEEVRDIFGDPQDLPQGKLILSYRKEYHPEIEQLLKKLGIPREGVFLQQLAKKDIEEVITGLTRHEELKKQYRLSVDSELPGIIADDLLEDRDSPIAPVLQILLTKMWGLVEEDEVRSFSVGLYQNLKREGILMGNFLDQQLEELHLRLPEPYESGLALNLLYFHTTELGTAAAQEYEALKARYSHRMDVLDELLAQCKSLYLLADGGTGRTVLAHDTLAPLVQSRFRNSDQPGQRASRILDNKVVEYANDKKTLLDETDLAIVEAGLAGMPDWGETEEELLEASRAQREKNRRRRRNVRMTFVALAALIAIAGIIAFQQSIVAKKNEKAAQENLATAIENEKKAKAEGERAAREAENAKRQTAIAEAEKIAADSARAVADQKTTEAVAALSLAEKRRIEAIENFNAAEAARQVAADSTLAAQEQRALAIRQQQLAEERRFLALAQSLAQKSTEVPNDTLQAQLAAQAYQFYQDFGREGEDTNPDVYRAIYEARKSLLGEENFNVLGRHDGAAVRDLAFAGPEVIYSTGSDGRLVAWDWKTGAETDLDRRFVNQTVHRALAVQADDRLLAGASGGPAVQVFDLRPGAQSLALPTPSPQQTWDLAFIPSQTRSNTRGSLVASGADTVIRISDLLADGRYETRILAQPGTPVKCLAVSPDGFWIVGGGENGQLFVWNRTRDDGEATFPIQDKNLHLPGGPPVTAVAFGRVGSQPYLAVGDDAGHVYLFAWNPGNLAGARASLLSGHQSRITALSFRTDGQQLASASWDRSIRLWNLANPFELPIELKDLDSWAMSVAFSPDGSLVVGGSERGQIRYWPTSISPLSNDLCGSLEALGNLDQATWKQYVGEDIPFSRQRYCGD